MLLLIACVLFLRQYGTTAAPALFPVPDSEPLMNEALIFTRDDSATTCLGRSTWDIVWSCLATTFAVTWVSVHPNIPWFEAGEWSVRGRKLFLMLVALLTPEVMIVWAYKQWHGAITITETMNQARPHSCPEMTRTQAHWLQMGGYKLVYVKGEIDAKCGDQYRIRLKKQFESAFSQRSNCLPDENVWEIVLTYDILANLLAEDKINFPRTTEEEIKDRSKGDALSKGMVLLQITWFLGQLTARAHQQLAISQIELTTAALAIVNSIAYLFWWSKPLDVRCPIVVQTKKVTILQMHADGMSQKDSSVEENRAIEDRDFYCKKNATQDTVSKWTFNRCPVEGDLMIGHLHLGFYLLTLARHSMSQVQLLIQHVLLDTAIFLHWPWIKSKIFTIFCTTHSAMHRTETSPSNREDGSFFIFRVMTWIFISCKSIAKTLIKVFVLLTVSPTMTISNNPASLTSNSMDFSDIRSRIQTKSKLQLLSDRDVIRWTFVSLFYSEEYETKPLLRFVASAGASFALIHCLAWNFDFPSNFERILWRTASLSLLGLLFCIFLGTTLIRYPHRGQFKVWFSDRVRPPTVRLAQYFISPFFPSAYSFFRISLLVIALLSVRNLPVSAFETVTWTGYIPHV